MAKGMVNELFEQVINEEQQKQQQQNGQRNGGNNGKNGGRNGDKKKMSSFTLQKFYEKNQQLKDSGDNEVVTATSWTQRTVSRGLHSNPVLVSQRDKMSDSR